MRAIRSAGKTNIVVKWSFPDDSQTVFVRRSACTIRGSASMLERGASCCMKWTSVDVVFRGVARVSMWLHSLEGHSFGSVRAARLQGLTPKQESLGGKLTAGEARHCGREAKTVSFQFSLQPPTNPDAKCRGQTDFRRWIKKICYRNPSRPAN